MASIFPRARASLLAWSALAAGSVLAAGAFVSPSLASRRIATQLSALEVCLAGPERVTADEAPIRVRRLHESPDRASLSRCAILADDLASSRLTRFFRKELARRAVDAAVAMEAGSLPDAHALWSAGAELPWSPPSALAGSLPAPPKPLLDEDLSELRRRLSGYAHLGGDIDHQPLDRVVIPTGRRALVAHEDARGQPLGAVSWGDASPASPFRASEQGDDVVVERGATRILVGKGKRPRVVGGHVVHFAGDELRARRVGDVGDLGPERVASLPSYARERGLRSCPTRTGHAVAIQSGPRIDMLHLSDGSLDAWGTVERGELPSPRHVGDWSLACDDAAASIAFAISEPMTTEDPLSTDRAPMLAEPGRHHRVVVARCAPRGCVRREAATRGVEAGWRSEGGYGSSMYMAAPTAMALGERVLLVWQTGRSLRYRAGELDRLDEVETPWIAEVSRPTPDAERDPRRVAWPQTELLARGGTALLLVSESRGPWAGFLVRIDASGARVLSVPAE